ncbi:MAG: ribbon-helix-helix protein, CopG family [Beijerinckiaceae bacterium]
MANSSATISLRLPPEALSRLEKASEKTRRSRSYLMLRALELHLQDIEREESQGGKDARLSTVLGLGGAGADRNAPRSAKDIDAHIRWLRDNG